MPGKLNLYAIGQGGVNVVKSPVQLADDECRSAQNAIFASNAAGGLEKRGGLPRLNASVLNAGANVLSIHNVGLPNPFNTSTLTRVYLYSKGAPLNEWLRSSDGVTWVGFDFPTGGAPFILGRSGLPDMGLPTIQPVTGRLLYVDSSSGGDKWRVYNTVSDEFILQVPPAVNPAVNAITSGAMCYHAGSFYISTSDDPDCRVYKFDMVTGQLTMINEAIGPGYIPTAMISYLGLLFVAATNLSSGAAPVSFVYKCDPLNSTAWTLDSADLVSPFTSMVNFKGNLYLCSGSKNAAVPMKIVKRTPSGVYSTVYTDASPWNGDYGGAMIEHGGKLLAYMGGLIVSSSDGVTWVTDLDVYTTYGSLHYAPGMPVIFTDGLLYWSIREYDGTQTNSRVLKRTTAGVWSVSYGPANIGNRTALTVLELP